MSTLQRSFAVTSEVFAGPVVGGVGSAVGSVVGGIYYVLVDNSAQAISL